MFRCLEAVRDSVEYLSIDSSRQSGNFDSVVRSIVCTPLSILEGLGLKGFHLPTKLMPESEHLNCRFLRLDRMTITSALWLLSACPRLQEMGICVENSGRHVEDFDTDVVELSCLRECAIEAKGGNFEKLLMAMRAPKLHTLKCQVQFGDQFATQQVHQQDYQQFSTTLRSFASTSGYTLQALSLTNLPLYFFPEILAGFPSLRSFQYLEHDYDGYLESSSALRLLRTMNAKRLCPHLEELVRHGSYSVEDMMELEQFILERSTPNIHNALCPIRRLRLGDDNSHPHGYPVLSTEELRTCAEVQKRIAELVDEIVIGKLALHKSTLKWVPSTGGGDWLQTWECVFQYHCRSVF
ncbi:hypothetical protein CALVIDRAFT_537256 [Calocera viscosa TUFC12733]|uniref:F-box domain-containing protein n=1 Tax=Calocera viscosa (strain TUFC12733) TaxID=1330018 RepID=A0A167M9Y0_CALVF|nr:hypothetical protein CALVIDRAFT_537256 [Calocera viscosa TUFC12733]